MRNKKGFTLIELLAVIVILAIIMVIAIPQILNVINNSRKSSWDNSVKLVARAIDLNNTLDQTGVTNGNSRTGYPLSQLCHNDTFDKTSFSNIVEAGDINLDTTTCESPSSPEGEYKFYINGKGQFSDYSATITCSINEKCSIESISSSSGKVTQNWDKFYYYDSTAEKHMGVSTSLDDSWVVWIQENTTTGKRELCRVFPNGTVCLEGNTSGFSNDFSSCSSSYVSYDGTGTTCLKGYAKAKADEMLSKGSTGCDVYSHGVDCYGQNAGYCEIYYSGTVLCRVSTNKTCYIWDDGKISCP